MTDIRSNGHVQRNGICGNAPNRSDSYEISASLPTSGALSGLFTILEETFCIQVILCLSASDAGPVVIFYDTLLEQQGALMINASSSQLSFQVQDTTVTFDLNLDVSMGTCTFNTLQICSENGVLSLYENCSDSRSASAVFSPRAAPDDNGFISISKPAFDVQPILVR